MDEIQAHLPEEPNSFIGRERELVELRQLLSRTRALTLCGPGGIGKTRLALRLLALAAAEFPDGVWFVELADLQQPDLVVSRIAAAMGITEEAGRPLLETLGEALRPRRLLLALDNCEHLLDACAQVGRRLLASAPGLRLLATSREPLSVAAETIWRVPPLSVAPAAPAAAAAAGAAGAAGAGGRGCGGRGSGGRHGRGRGGRGPLRGGPAVRRPGRGLPARVRRRPGQHRGRHLDLPRA